MAISESWILRWRSSSFSSLYSSERVLHLLEPVVVQPRGVDVGAGQPRAERLAQLHREVDRAVAVLRVVHRYIDVLVHALPRLLEFELDGRGALGRDGDVPGDRARLVVERPAVLVDAP